MVNYRNGKIYKLVFNGETDIYVGSTTRPLRKRLHGHRNEGNTRVKEMVEKVGKTNVKIILLENYPCNSKDELTAKEQEYIDLLKPKLNIVPANVNVMEGVYDYKYWEDKKDPELKRLETLEILNSINVFSNIC